MIIYRNKKEGITTKAYRELMNTPKKARLVRDAFNSSVNIFNTGLSEKQFAAMYRNRIVIDPACPKIMECRDTTNCCICENLSHFIQMTDAEKFEAQLDLKNGLKEIVIEQIVDKESEIATWKSKEELQKELDILNERYKQLN